ncbi:sarcoplasmic/endoplasmic reticulum calcium ATPase regulator ARLN [Thomomys bottae]
MERGAEAAAAAPAVAGQPDGVQERRGRGAVARAQGQNHLGRLPPGPNGVPKHSYWLDLWLFILLDVMLFVFFYLLP